MASCPLLYPCFSFDVFILTTHSNVKLYFSAANEALDDDEVEEE